ncbi:hypothetical protein C4J96_2918 [Pseudomonas orientalis]|nr:hypothetical protein C4J96_2918 [Pseudomonas orientalis]
MGFLFLKELQPTWPAELDQNCGRGLAPDGGVSVTVCID